jgi:hypothetical protein
MFGPKKVKLKGWMVFYKEELHKLYFSSGIIMVIKSRRMRLAGNVADMGIMRTTCNIAV